VIINVKHYLKFYKYYIMPFKNLKQSKKCFLLKSKGKAGTWNCDEFAKETNYKTLPKGKTKKFKKKK